MKHTIILPQQIKSGEDALIIGLLKDQPPDGYVTWTTTEKTVCFVSVDGKYSGYDDPRRTGCPLQYPVGLELKIKGMEDSVIVTKNTVKRVQELTIKELLFLDFPMKKIEGMMWLGMDEKGTRKQFITHFNSRFAKPRKEGDEYVCYPYDIESINYTATKDSDNSCYIYWIDGKEVTIKSNPYMELFTVRAV